MIGTKLPGTFTGAGLLSAFAASLCCITPVIALLAGSSSIAANFSWIEPARPYLIGLSIAVLAFAWYVKLKPAKSVVEDCNCDTTGKIPFLQSKTFLSIVTAFAVLMMAFPLYRPSGKAPRPSVNTNACSFWCPPRRRDRMTKPPAPKPIKSSSCWTRWPSKWKP